MLDYNKVVTSLFGLVGFQQNLDDNGIQLSNGLIASSSGLTYHVHPYLTTRNILAMAPDFLDLGDVSEEQTLFNSWLERFVKNEIKNFSAEWLSKKVAENTGKSVLTIRPLFRYKGYPTFSTVPANKRLGFISQPLTRSTLLSMRSLSVGLSFSQPQAVTIHLQYLDAATPFHSQEISYDGHGIEKFYTLDYIISLSEQRGFSCYYETTGLQAKVIAHRGDCDCHLETEHLKVRGFSADIPSDVNTDPFQPIGSRENYGLNMKMELRCDYTNLLVDQQHAFSGVLAKYVGIKLMEHMASNPDSKLTGYNVDANSIIYAIDGDPRGRKEGLRKELETAWTAANFDREGFDELCLPCNEDYGIERQKN